MKSILSMIIVLSSLNLFAQDLGSDCGRAKLSLIEGETTLRVMNDVYNKLGLEAKRKNDKKVDDFLNYEYGAAEHAVENRRLTVEMACPKQAK